MLKIVHTNFNVIDQEKSVKWYGENLELYPVREKIKEGRFKLIFLSNEENEQQIELTYLFDRTEPYDLSDNEIHLAFRTDRFEELYARHKANGCVCKETSYAEGIYFICDPDGYWIEIIKQK